MREYGTKATLLFLPADEEVSWLLLRSSGFLLSGSMVHKTPIPVSLR